MAASVWRYLGFNLVVTFGALQSVSSDQYDAARLEGGNGWPSFWRITFRSIRLVQLLQFALLRNETRAELKRLHQRLGATTVYVTHDQHEAMTLAGRGTSRMAGGNGHQHPMRAPPDSEAGEVLASLNEAAGEDAFVAARRQPVKARFPPPARCWTLHPRFFIASPCAFESRSTGR